MEDEKNVQLGTVLPESETVLPEAETQVKPQPQPLTEERMNEILAEREELLKRQFQSSKDREIAQVRREAEDRIRRAEGKSSIYESSFAGLDEESREKVELAQLRGRDQLHQSQEQRDQITRGFYEVVGAFEANMTQHITDLGIDPSDKRIDWGDRNSQNLTDRQGKILTSVARIQKENIKAAGEKQKQEFKDLEAGLRKDLGLDSVDTSTSTGVSDSDADFQKKWNAGEIPASKENIARINKILGS